MGQFDKNTPWRERGMRYSSDWSATNYTMGSDSVTAKEMVGTAKENRITIAEASKIIKDGGSYLPASWVKDNLTLYELRQGVIYSIFQELLDYSKNNPSSGYNKIRNAIFANVWLLARRLGATITPERNICGSFSQVAGINFIETFAPTVRRELLRFFFGDWNNPRPNCTSGWHRCLSREPTRS